MIPVLFTRHVREPTTCSWFHWAIWKYMLFFSLHSQSLTSPTPIWAAMSEQVKTHTHTHSHSNSHSPCRQLCILPTDFQSLGIHSVFAFHLLPGCSFIIHPSSEKHLKWLCFSFFHIFFFFPHLILPSCSRSFWLDGTKVNHESRFFFFVSDLCHFHCVSRTTLVRGPDM